MHVDIRGCVFIICYCTDESRSSLDSDDDSSVESEEENDSNIDKLVAEGNLELDDFLDSVSVSLSELSRK